MNKTIKIIFFNVLLFLPCFVLAQQIYKVENKKIESEPLQFAGSLVPGNIAEISSPANAIVTKKHVNFGDKVKKGDLLFELSSLELTMKLNDAKVQFFENTQNLEKLKNWSTATEVLQAQHNMNRTDQEYRHTHKHFEQTKKLYEAGIVSKEEYLNDERYNRESLHHYQQAKQQFEDIKRKGSEKFVSIAQMKVEQSKQQVDMLTQKVASLSIQAPFTGIFLAPQRQKDNKDNWGPTEKSTVQEDQVLGVIADNEALYVKIQVDEFDIIHVHKGQEAQINLLAFHKENINGKIHDINTMTNPGSQTQQAANFDVKIALEDLPQKLKEKILLGMTCTVQLKMDSLQGLIVPKQAIVYDKGESYVNVIVDDKQARKKVELGETSSNFVVVSQGIQSGDQIVVHS